MQAIGLILVTVGCLGAALVAVLDPAAVTWGWYVPALGCGVLGVAVVQVAVRRYAKDATRLETNAQVLTGSLDAIVKELNQLDREASGDDATQTADQAADQTANQTIDPYTLPARIDQSFRDHITAFVDARESIGHIWGMRAYGEVMSHFAAGERYLNRVWSAAADGYIDEARTYIGRSRDQFAEAQSKLGELTARRGAA
ncbi:hypothetical protein [Haliangium sp.]|uniref:hypothetical protein n=1 Tax=Haliangium sp. TaxID=2663208 RepID=UPI003D0CFDE2